jgi:hypothetical protein
MPRQQTIRACKSAVTDLADWINNYALVSIRHMLTGLKFLFFKEQDRPVDNSVIEHIETFENIGDIQPFIEIGFTDDNQQLFTVKIKGTLTTNNKGAMVNIKILFDELDEIKQLYKPVYKKAEPQNDNTLVPFEYVSQIGRINEETKEFTDWIPVTKIQPQWMIFARKGNRRIKARIQLFDEQSSKILAQCSSIFEFHNRQQGYLDIAENTEKSRALAVTLAFSLSAADRKMYKCEIERINEWALSIYRAESDAPSRKELSRALKKSVRFFRKGHKINIEAICNELSKTTLQWQRNDILSMCLNVVSSKGFISAGQIRILKELSQCFEIDPERFRSLMERLAPVDKHQVKDPELVIGLSNDLTDKQKRELLNNEYRKWNARVTNVNPEVRSQANMMIELITEARTQYLN